MPSSLRSTAPQREPPRPPQPGTRDHPDRCDGCGGAAGEPSIAGRLRTEARSEPPGDWASLRACAAPRADVARGEARRHSRRARAGRRSSWVRRAGSAACRGLAFPICGSPMVHPACWCATHRPACRGRSVAATFSRSEAAANGAVIGRDARALGVDVILRAVHQSVSRSDVRARLQHAWRGSGADGHSRRALRDRGARSGRDGAGEALRRLRRCRRRHCRWTGLARDLSGCRSRPSSTPVSPRSCARTTVSTARYSCGNEDCSSEPCATSTGSGIRHLGLGRDPWRGVHHARTGHGAAGNRARGVLRARPRPDEPQCRKRKSTSSSKS